MYRILKHSIFIIILCIFIFPISLNAETIDCEYNYKDLKLTFDTDNLNSVNVSAQGFKEKNINLLVYKTSETVDLDKDVIVGQSIFMSAEETACPAKLKVCTYSFWSIDTNDPRQSIGTIINSFDEGFFSSLAEDFKFIDEGKRLLIYTQNEYDKSGFKRYEKGHIDLFSFDEVKRELFGDTNVGFFKQFEAELLGFFQSMTHIKTAEGAETYAFRYEKVEDCVDVMYGGDLPTYNAECPAIEALMNKYDGIINDYKKCSDNSCKIMNKSKIEVTENEIKDQCKMIMPHYNYDGEQAKCLETCLSLIEIFNSKKENTDLSLESLNNSRPCGLSEKLLVWILNIIKWVKYIIPVIVILFGMVDFIRGFVSDKDDGLKKAQGRFVKRLIAAALIFIVPLIITFILEKMGFSSSMCGINF